MASPLPQEAYRKNAEVYKVMANPKRLEILNLLKLGEMTVGALVKAMGLRKANVSQHLAVLRHVRLVHVRRNGLHVYYRIVSPAIVEPCKILHSLRKRKIVH